MEQGLLPPAPGNRVRSLGEGKSFERPHTEPVFRQGSPGCVLESSRMALAQCPTPLPTPGSQPSQKTAMLPLVTLISLALICPHPYTAQARIAGKTSGSYQMNKAAFAVKMIKISKFKIIASKTVSTHFSLVNCVCYRFR